MQDVSLSTCGRSGPICPLVRLPTTAETVSSARHGGYKEEQIRFRLIKPRTYADGPTFLIGQNPLRTAITGGKIPTAAMPVPTDARRLTRSSRPAKVDGTSDLRRDEGLFVPSPRNRRGMPKPRLRTA
jgi:hypothetical protein